MVRLFPNLYVNKKSTIAVPVDAFALKAKSLFFPLTAPPLVSSVESLLSTETMLTPSSREAVISILSALLFVKDTVIFSRL